MPSINLDKRNIQVTAFLFPGQGSQSVGMGKSLHDSYPLAREIFQKADSALGYSISKLCFEGPEETLRMTANTQPAILTVSIAAFMAFKDKRPEIKPDFVAGHSLGEYSALVASGSISFEDAVTLVHHRGRYMQEAVPAGEGGMVAVLGLPEENLKSLCDVCSNGEILEPANLNSPSQIVLAGHIKAIERVIEKHREFGAKRAIELPVSAPFHCQLMKPAQDRLKPELLALKIKVPICPLISNITARGHRNPEEIRDNLIKQISSPVLWSSSMSFMIENGVNNYWEIGPGNVLSGIGKKMSREAVFNSISEPDELKKFD